MIIICIFLIGCGKTNVGNDDIFSQIYDEFAIDFLDDIVFQIIENNPDYLNECYCDTNNNELLEPYELPYLDWEFSNSENKNYLKGIEFIESGMYLDSIPTSIQYLMTLENITIQNSQISDIPTELFNLYNL